MTFLQHLTQLVILSLYTVSILTLDLLIMSFNGFHPIWLIAHTTSLYLIIGLFLILYTQVLLMVQFLALCFSLCVLSLWLPLLTHTIIHHSFADDLQLEMSATPIRISELLHSVQSCMCDVKVWATANMLKLNDNKTELMLVTSNRSKHLHNLPSSITIGNAQFPFKKSVKNLGITLHCHLTMNAHVSKIARTCYLELRRLASILRFLTSTTTATLVSAFVSKKKNMCDF